MSLSDPVKYVKYGIEYEVPCIDFAAVPPLVVLMVETNSGHTTLAQACQDFHGRFGCAPAWYTERYWGERDVYRWHLGHPDEHADLTTRYELFFKEEVASVAE